MPELTSSSLKLLAHTADDLTAMSVYLQDGLLPLASIKFEEEKKRLSFLVNRFCWEHVESYEELKNYYRIHTTLCFENVEKLHLKGFDQKTEQRIFNILALSFVEGHPSTLTIICSGNHEIRLTLKNLDCQFTDIDQPWPTSKKPTHLHEHLDELNQKTA